MEERVVLLLKFFSEKIHREEFISGLLFTNSMGYYVKNEGEQNKGRGDNLEGIVRAEKVKGMILQDKETGRIITPSLSSFTANFEGVSDTHIFCMTIMEFDWLKETESGLQYIIPKEVLEVFRSEYGEYVCLVPAKEFINQVNTASKNQNLESIYNPVEYFDVKKFWAERMIAVNSDKFFFQKNVRYLNEHEFRIVFKNVHGDKPVKINLGNPIKVVDNIETIDDLINFLESKIIKINYDK